MPKKKKTLKESKNSKLLNSYLNFIDSNFSSNTFTYRNVVDWLNDSEDTTGKNVNFIVAMLVKSWILSEYIIDNGDGTFTPIYFEDDEEEYSFKDVDIEDDERLGKPEFDDEYIRDYGNRDMKFPKINDSFDEGKKLNKKKMIKEFKVDYNSLSYDDLLDILADMIIDDNDGIEDKTYEEYIDIIDDSFRNLVIPVADRLSDRFAGVPSEYWDWLKKQKSESKKSVKNERRAIIEKYAKVRKHK